MPKFSKTIFILVGCLILGISEIHCAVNPEESKNTIILQLRNREISVNGKTVEIDEIVQTNGKQGLELSKGDRFTVTVENNLKVPSTIHWHGLLVPNNQDGVAYITQVPIKPGEKYDYDFPILQAGTFWMHDHYTLEQQRLLEAPLILNDPQEKQSDEKQIVIFCTDFSFRDPMDILKKLQSQGMMSRMMGGMMSHGMMGGGMMGMGSPNEVQYDAFLTNGHTLSDPVITEVVPGKIVRLRIINGASATNFIIDLGNLEGEAIAVDGSDIIPFRSNQFQLGVAQRIDIRVKIPEGSEAQPILALVEDSPFQTGIILKALNQKVPKLSEVSSRRAPFLSYAQEFIMHAQEPLPEKSIDRRLNLYLGGGMHEYVWTLNGKAWPNTDSLFVKKGERVELRFINDTMMAHPMHLHGHVFQITEINGRPISGAKRDTVLVQPFSTVKVEFDANNIGNWMLHCHNLYHMHSGMMTTLLYEEFKGPFYKRPDLEHFD